MNHHFDGRRASPTRWRRTFSGPTPSPPSQRAFKCQACWAKRIKMIFLHIVVLHKRSLTISTWRSRRLLDCGRGRALCRAATPPPPPWWTSPPIASSRALWGPAQLWSAQVDLSCSAPLGRGAAPPRWWWWTQWARRWPVSQWRRGERVSARACSSLEGREGAPPCLAQLSSFLSSRPAGPTLPRGSRRLRNSPVSAHKFSFPIGIVCLYLGKNRFVANTSCRKGQARFWRKAFLLVHNVHCTCISDDDDQLIQDFLNDHCWHLHQDCQVARLVALTRSLAPFSFKTRSNALRLDLLASTAIEESIEGFYCFWTFWLLWG